MWAPGAFWTGAGNLAPRTVKPVASCYNLYKIYKIHFRTLRVGLKVTGIVCVCVEQDSNPHILAKTYVWRGGLHAACLLKLFPSNLKLKCLDVLF